MADVKKLRPSKKWDILAPKVLIIVSVLEKALKNARAMASGYILDNLDERFAGTKQKGGYKFGGDGMGTSGTITWVRPGSAYKIDDAAAFATWCEEHEIYDHGAVMTVTFPAASKAYRELDSIIEREGGELPAGVSVKSEEAMRGTLRVSLTEEQRAHALDTAVTVKSLLTTLEMGDDELPTK